MNNNENILNLDFKSNQYSIHKLMSMIEDKSLKLEYCFNKEIIYWDNDKNSQFIESILIRAPIMPIILNNTLNDYLIIDGLNRLNALYKFINNDFNLSDLKFLYNLNGYKWKDLHRSYQRRIEETDININAIWCHNQALLSKVVSNYL